HELLPPADGLFASGVAAFPPPHATVEPTSIPATADTARAFAMFMTLVSSLLLEERLALLQRLVRRLPPGSVQRRARLTRYRPTEAFFFPRGGRSTYDPHRQEQFYGGSVASLGARIAPAHRTLAARRPRAFIEVASCRGQRSRS